MTSANTLRTLGCRSHRLMDVQISQVVPDLVYLYHGRGFAPLVPILQSIKWGGSRKEFASEDQGKNVAEYLSLLLIC